jgi:hypothetical protein
VCVREKERIVSKRGITTEERCLTRKACSVQENNAAAADFHCAAYKYIKSHSWTHEHTTDILVFETSTGIKMISCASRCII